MEIEYTNDGAVAYFQGERYHLDRSNGYYKRRQGNSSHYLHRAVYRAFKGHIPTGYEVHHLDGNRANNEPENLVAIAGAEHHRIHAEMQTDAQRESKARNIVAKAMPKAKTWHKSEAGREWHKRHFAEQGKLMQERDYVCQCCGKQFRARINGAKYCSVLCKNKVRRASGVDNERRVCPICGRTYEANRYSKAITCGVECGRISRKRKLYQSQGDAENETRTRL